jgi:hypothetical protein
MFSSRCDRVLTKRINRTSRTTYDGINPKPPRALTDVHRGISRFSDRRWNDTHVEIMMPASLWEWAVWRSLLQHFVRTWCRYCRL